MASASEKLVASIYRAGAGMESWTHPLRGIAELTGSENVTIQVGNLDVIPTTLVYLLHDGELNHDLMAGYGDFMAEQGDPRTDHANRLYRSGQVTLFGDHEFIAEREMRRHPYYAEVLRQFGLKHALVQMLPRRANIGSGVTLQRTPAQGPGTDAVAKILSTMAFHVDQALKIQETLNAELLADPAEIRPFRLPPNAAVLSERSRLLKSSSELESLVIRPGVLRLRGLQLKGSTVRIQEMLDQCLWSASRGRPEQITLTSRALRLQFLPVVPDHGAFLPAKRIALIPEPMESKSLDPTEFARQRYGLTPTEAMTVQLLSTGCSLQEISERRSVSVWTVRTQMKSVFQKMEVKSQREVLARIAKLAQSKPD